MVKNTKTSNSECALLIDVTVLLFLALSLDIYDFFSTESKLNEKIYKFKDMIIFAQNIHIADLYRFPPVVRKVGWMMLH